MQRTLESRVFISALLAMATGAFLFYTHPYPDEQIFLRVIAWRAPQAFLSFQYLYYMLLFTTPFLVYSTVLSGLYIFTLKARRRISPGRLPGYPDPRKRDDLFLVVGEVHNPRKSVPAEASYWLTIPERGLFTGIAIFGAIGSGKTSCRMLPFAEQVLAYQAADKDKRIGGLILEVKGDFCREVKDILGRHQRAEDYIEISLDSEYRYNPLRNDLDAYALAYNIASLLNNLFGRGKEPFWQQACTNLKDIRHVYLDLDRKGDEALEAIRNSVDTSAPNFVLDTSPGKHQVVWKIAGVTQEEAESLLHSLANQFGGDPAATDSTRVLRLPGFTNRKLPEEFIVRAR